MDVISSPFQCTLPPALLAEAFPFHFVLDRDCRIIQAGRILQRLMPEIVGTTLGEQLRIKRPTLEAPDFAEIVQRSQRLFLLETAQTELVFKGQMMPVEADGVIFFLGSPDIKSIAQLRSTGIHLKEFAIHDPITDFLLLLQTQENLTEELEEQRGQLRQALREKEEIAEQAEQKARDRAREAEEALQALKQTQVQLIQTEKMSALGQMVAGIAHEINNPLTYISGNLHYIDDYAKQLIQLLSLLKKHQSYDHQAVQDFIEEIELDFLVDDLPEVVSSLRVGSDRMKETVIALRNFSRSDDAAQEAVDLHDGIDSTLRILNHKMKQGICVIKEYGQLPLVKCYPAQLNQVFMNILSNAADALMESEQQNRVIQIETALDDDGSVWIRMRDNAGGMPPDVQAKIFDPFFTTKPIGKGTGLGLPICHQIIEKHEGAIAVDSMVGAGTVFTIRIPVA